MALRYTAADADLAKAAGIIMATLPVCRERHIAYSTFTIVELDPWGAAPGAGVRQPAVRAPARGPSRSGWRRKSCPCPTWRAGPRPCGTPGSRPGPGTGVVFFSDGVAQAGMGRPGTPLGWGQEAVARALAKLVRERPRISARHLARALVQRALALDGSRAGDDITCGVVYYREPREVLVLTGAPANRARGRRDAPGRRRLPGPPRSSAAAPPPPS